MEHPPLYSPEHRSVFEQLLTERRRGLRVRLQDTLAQGSASWQSAPQPEVTDTKDQATHNLSAEAAAAEVARLREALGDTEQALERLEAGAFGLCTRCGEPIALERLRSAPSSPRCRSCQERFEAAQGRAQYGSPT
jgi:RNA polymerase-binding transcription factor